jgi:sulfide:quinone oxidoreductase
VLFGRAISDSVRQLLEENGILTITSTHAEVHKGGRVALHPGDRELHVDRIVALPRLVGPSVPGVPTDDTGGFIPVDAHGKVPRLDRVYAAGDATQFPVKHGCIAAQQADVAAQSIAALAGLGAEPERFHPELYGILLTGARPRYLHAHITGGHGSGSELTDTPTWEPTAKIAAKYLAPYLEHYDRATGAVH